MRVRLTWTDHLVSLVGATEAASARIALADPAARSALAASARRTAARASARLDASPLEDATADAVDAREAAGEPLVPGTDLPVRPSGGGWAQVLKLEGMPTQDVAAVEYANLLRAWDAEAALAPRVFDDPLAVLGELHGRICQGLVAPEVLGAPRRTAQSVSDGAQGRVLYHAPDPEHVPRLLDELASWLGDASAALPAVAVAGIVTVRLLDWHPYEAGNGRAARAAGRLVLRARGLDPDAVAAPEASWAADPLGYFAEVAATRRRGGDVGRWLERYAEAVSGALDVAAAALWPGTTGAATSSARLVAEALAPGEALTVAEFAERTGTRREFGVAQLRALVREGSLIAEPGTSGLRFRRPA